MSDVFPPIHLYAVMAAAAALLTGALKDDIIGWQRGWLKTMASFGIVLVPAAQILADIGNTLVSSPNLEPYKSWTLAIHAVVLALFIFVLVTVISGHVRRRFREQHSIANEG